MSNHPALNELRTAAVDRVLDAVRRTGTSAHAPAGKPYSDLVFYIAVKLDRNPVEVQAEVEAYADALDSLR